MSKIKIALTTGDVDGIGLEVTTKALLELGPKPHVQFILFRDAQASPKNLKILDSKFKRITVENIDQALCIKGPALIDIASDLTPAGWVEVSAKACYENLLSGMATAPLSKTSIHEAGLKDIGHTDILKRISSTKSAHMGFVGNKFNVVLATGHIPIKDVSKKMTLNALSDSLVSANKLRLALPSSQLKRPIAVLGLNPHAGEQRLIGEEEYLLYPQLQSFAKKHKIPIEGPLVPDAAFFPQNWKKYSVYLAAYHDQGLIPFKMIHGQDSGAHITLGIPFVRTSVDHGTAKDIFGQNKANPHSMLDAISWAIKLARLNS